MIRAIQLEDDRQTRPLLALQKASYTIEAELIGSYELPPLKDTLTSLQSCGETFFGYFVNEELAGAISYKKVGDILDIHRMMVSPAYFRRGLATALLRFLLSHETGYAKVIVSTGAKNHPAKQLYTQFGFSQVAEKEVIPGLTITLFEKVL